MKVNSLVKSLFRNFGYELQRVQKGWGDIFLIQKELLHTLEVNTIFDLGSNIGRTVGRYKELFPKSRIYGFEPFKEPYMQIVETYRNDESIKPHNMAVTNKCGRQQFYLNQSNETNSLLPTASEWGKYFDTSLTHNVGITEVETTTLDRFCQQANINHIQILKMDIQGGEMMALEGAKNLLNLDAVDLIYTEIMFAKFYENQANFYDMQKLLQNCNFLVYGLYDLRYGKNGTLAQADAIFIHRSIEEKLQIRF
jgi:FkbM family methyltransferase